MNFLSNAWNGVKDWWNNSGPGTFDNPMSPYAKSNTDFWGSPTSTSMAGMNNAFVQNNPQYQYYTTDDYGNKTSGMTTPSAPVPSMTSYVDENVQTPSQRISATNIATNPVNFSVGGGDTVDSSLLSGSNMSDAMKAYDSASTNFASGKSTATPTDAYMGSLYNAYQYTPEQLQMKQQDMKLGADVVTEQLSQERKIREMQINGEITKEQAAPMIQDIRDRSNARLADLNASRAYNAIPLSMAELQRQNSIQGLTALSPFYSPQTLTPGTSLVNPQGQVFIGPDGLPTSGVTQNNQGAIMGSAVQSGLNARQEAFNYGIQNGLDQQLAAGVIKSPNSGDYYISDAQLPPSAINRVGTASGRSGIAYVPKENVGNVQSLDTAIGQMTNLHTLANQYLTPGIFGRIKGMTTNQINSYLQLDPGWAKFNAVRLNAINYLKGLAQGGGFRTNQSEIDTAANSLTDIQDNLESANAKIQTAVENLDRAFKEYLPTHKDTQLNAPTQKSGAGSVSIGNNGFKLVNGKWVVTQ